MRKTMLMLIGLTLVTVGCAPNPRRAKMTLEDKRGTWELIGVDRAELKMDGWSVFISETEVADANVPHYLEKFKLTIVNTDATRPLHLKPGEIWLTDLNNTALLLGPDKSILLEEDQSWSLLFAPGARAPLLPYPFTLTVTAFRGAKFSQPQTVVFKLY